MASLGLGAVAQAADPQPYRVDLASTGQSELDAMLRASSNLVSLREHAPVSPLGLIARARGDLDRLKTVLESFGYYQSSVDIRIESKALKDPGLPDALNALPRRRDARVELRFALGPQYRIGTVKVEGELPPGTEDLLGLNAGAPAVAQSVLDAGARLLTGLEERGYAFAKVDPPVAYEDPTLPLLDVRFHVTAGPKVRIGAIRIVGLHRLHESVVRRRLLLHTGEQYDSRTVERARQDLNALGLFAAVSVRLGHAVDATGGVPITFELRERPRHAINLTANYSTDLGGSGGVSWTDRDVFGHGDQLTVAASVLNLGGSDTTGVGYATSIKLVEPDFGHRDQQLQVSVGANRVFLEAYDQTAQTSSAALVRKLSSLWTASVGVSAAEESILQDAKRFDYTLLALPLTARYDSTDLKSPLDDPAHGMRDSIGIAPTRSLGHPSATFVVTQLKIAAYFDLEHLLGTASGRSVVAMRASAGIAQGAGEFSLPPDQRFYGGGSDTIRGYPYQEVGPEFAGTHIPIGGTALLAGTLEFRQRIGEHFGAALFADGGQVSTRLKPEPSDFYVGVGGGMRYYTPIGPIRLDVAVPTRIYTADGQRFQVYIGLGQAF